MQPSCFVTDGKEELMQTSKNHFEAKVIFNDETIRRMFRTEFYTYEGMQRLVWLAVAFALVMLALFVPIPTVVKVLCLLVGRRGPLLRLHRSQGPRYLEAAAGGEHPQDGHQDRLERQLRDGRRGRP